VLNHPIILPKTKQKNFSFNKEKIKMLNQIKDGNTVKIEGILSEIDLKYGTLTKNGVESKTVGGSIKVRVNTQINKEDVELEIPVHMFATQYTNAGASNPAYESIERVMNEFVSIAASDIDRADRVRITRGQIGMNEYYGQNGNLVSFPRVSASFVSKIKKDECKPDATFSVTFMVGSKGYELDKDGVETDRYKIMGMIPQYGNKVDVVPFYATNPGVIDAVSNYWNDAETVKATGKLNFSSKTETTMVEVDFGEPSETTRTISVSELIITGGSSTPLEGDFAINYDDVKAALEDRKARLAELKEKSQNKGTSGKAPAPAAGNKFKDLGF
jgi:hypothetical protein